MSEPNASIVESASNGVTRILHFEDDKIVVQRSYDAEAVLKACAEERALTAGQRWGEMRKVGHIPAAEYEALLDRTRGMSQNERLAIMVAWIRQNPAFATFDKALK